LFGLSQRFLYHKQVALFQELLSEEATTFLLSHFHIYLRTDVVDDFPLLEQGLSELEILPESVIVAFPLFSDNIDHLDIVLLLQLLEDELCLIKHEQVGQTSTFSILGFGMRSIHLQRLVDHLEPILVHLKVDVALCRVG
jgi:hypothetical protein